MGFCYFSNVAVAALDALEKGAERVGIWGLSYGGVLTAQALARNSDVFKVGVDLAGVHLWGNSLDPDNVSYRSSAISAIDTWKSPVLLIHGYLGTRGSMYIMERLCDLALEACSKPIISDPSPLPPHASPPVLPDS